MTGDWVIKICGVRTPEHALAALEAGADMLGFMFAPSRRQVTPQQVAPIIAAVREWQVTHPRARPARMVGVFVNASTGQTVEIARACDLNALQLSGDEPWSVAQDLPPQYLVVKALRAMDTPEEQRWIEHAGSGRVRLLLDAHVAGSYGGTGVTADWNRAAQLARQRDLILAGGLNPENVAEAIAQVRPWGMVQDLPPQYLVIKALRAIDTPEEQRWIEHAGLGRVRLLLDAHVAGSYGGTGVTADWARAAQLARQRDLILAGGLNPENVAEAIAQVRPWGVDVSSGVETNGVKDSARIAAFVAAARTALNEQQEHNRR